MVVSVFDGSPLHARGWRQQRQVCCLIILVLVFELACCQDLGCQDLQISSRSHDGETSSPRISRTPLEMAAEMWSFLFFDGSPLHARGWRQLL